MTARERRVGPRRVLVTGDIHGNLHWAVAHVLKAARRHKADLILQVGDLKVWAGREGARFLDGLEREAAAVGVAWDFVDGNHEDFDELLAYPLGPDGRRIVRPHVRHLPRGFRWSWGGRSFMALGGAGSIDRDELMPGMSWWPQEVITEEDVRACTAGGAIDVLISHDAPKDVRLRSGWGVPSEEVLADLEASRTRLQEVVDACRPAVVMHGHWHRGQRAVVERPEGGSYEVISLGAEGQKSGHCAVLDVDALWAGVSPADTVSVID